MKKLLISNLLVCTFVAGCTCFPFVATTPVDTYDDPNPALSVLSAGDGQWWETLRPRDIVNYEGFRIHHITANSKVNRGIRILCGDDFSKNVVVFNILPDVVESFRANLFDEKKNLNIDVAMELDPFFHILGKFHNGEDHFMLTDTVGVSVSKIGRVPYFRSEDGTISTSIDRPEEPAGKPGQKAKPVGSKASKVCLPTYRVDVGGDGWVLFRPLKGTGLVHKVSPIRETETNSLVRGAIHETNRARVEENTSLLYAEMKETIKKYEENLKGSDSAIEYVKTRVESLKEILNTRVPEDITNGGGEDEASASARRRLFNDLVSATRDLAATSIDLQKTAEKRVQLMMEIGISAEDPALDKKLRDGAADAEARHNVAVDNLNKARELHKLPKRGMEKVARNRLQSARGVFKSNCQLLVEAADAEPKVAAIRREEESARKAVTFWKSFASMLSNLRGAEAKLAELEKKDPKPSTLALEGARKVLLAARKNVETARIAANLPESDLEKDVQRRLRVAMEFLSVNEQELAAIEVANVLKLQQQRDDAEVEIDTWEGVLELIGEERQTAKEAAAFESLIRLEEEKNLLDNKVKTLRKAAEKAEKAFRLAEKD